jgi:serine/threonine-protein kinase
MGTVYLASRIDAEFHKQVALKVVTSGADRAEVVNRFERERRILSSLEHPNIARLLDGGAAEDGRPYIVMDYVKGLPLHEHCERNGLSTTVRLQLFRQVCDAVQYAHRNLIVHRDLKPRNVLVTPDGVPKLLDFGIAKLLNAEIWGETYETGTGFGPLTPEYASPEQVRGEAITTATDVYSLGTMLYVLLTGRLPYRLEGRQPLEVLKAVTEQEPERPSVVVRTASASAPSPAETLKQGTTQRLSVRLRGDLDTILLTALRKEPDRRYPSVEAFSEDIRRHLEGLPIKARKGTFAYLGSKFVRRHKTSLTAAAGVLLCLVGLTAFSVRERVLAERARSRAEQERDRAETEAAKSKAVVAFLQETLGSANPYEGTGRDVTVMEVLAKAAAATGGAFAHQPEIQAALQTTIGGTYRDLSRFDEAEALIRSALETRRHAHGEQHLDVAESLDDLAELLYRKGEYEATERLFREALAMRRQLLGEEHPAVAQSMNNLAAVLEDQAAYEEAEPLHRQALTMQRKLLGDEHLAVAESLNNLAVLLDHKGDAEGAEPLHREALAIQRRLLGNEHPHVATSLNNLAVLLRREGDAEAAEPLYREALAIRRELLGDEHPEVAISLNNLAILLWQEGDIGAAEPLLREALTMKRTLLGNAHPDVALGLNALARLLDEKGEPDSAYPLHVEALRILEKALVADHWRTADVRGDYGSSLILLGRFEEAEPLLLDVYPVLRAQLGDDHDRTRNAVRRLVQLYEAWNKPEAAAKYQALLGQGEGEALRDGSSGR